MFGMRTLNGHSFARAVRMCTESKIRFCGDGGVDETRQVLVVVFRTGFFEQRRRRARVLVSHHGRPWSVECARVLDREAHLKHPAFVHQLNRSITCSWVVCGTE